MCQYQDFKKINDNHHCLMIEIIAKYIMITKFKDLVKIDLALQTSSYLTIIIFN